MSKWKCMICGHIFEGNTPPDSCPGIPKHQSRFKEIQESESMKIQVETIIKEHRYLDIKISKGESRTKN